MASDSGEDWARALDLPSSAAAPSDEAVVNFGDVRKRKFMEGLFRDHWNDLVLWLTRKFGSGPPEPEEIAQGAFTTIAGLEQIDNIRNPKAFLFTVAANRMLKGIRWQTRIRQVIGSEMELFSGNLEEITPERLYMAGESLERLRGAMQNLTPKQQEILFRSRIQGQTYQQIGAETGWSDADISRQLKQSLNQLRAFRPDAKETDERTPDER